MLRCSAHLWKFRGHASTFNHHVPENFCRIYFFGESKREPNDTTAMSPEHPSSLRALSWPAKLALMGLIITSTHATTIDTEKGLKRTIWWWETAPIDGWISDRLMDEWERRWRKSKLSESGLVQSLHVACFFRPAPHLAHCILLALTSWTSYGPAWGYDCCWRWWKAATLRLE